MAYLIAAIVMTLSVLEGHSTIASIFSCDILHLWCVMRSLCICKGSCLSFFLFFRVDLCINCVILISVLSKFLLALLSLAMSRYHTCFGIWWQCSGWHLLFTEYLVTLLQYIGTSTGVGELAKGTLLFPFEVWCWTKKSWDKVTTVCCECFEFAAMFWHCGIGDRKGI